MVAVSRLLCCIFLLATLPAVRLACFPKGLRLHYMRKSISYLKSMGERLPRACQQEAMRINISHERQLLDLKKSCTFSTLELVFNRTESIFRKNKTAVNWDVSKLNTFIHLLNLQSNHYSTCGHLSGRDMISKSSQREENDEKGVYFRKLTDFLSTEKYSRCAWETVRAETQALLMHVLSFIRNPGYGESTE